MRRCGGKKDKSWVLVALLGLCCFTAVALQHGRVLQMRSEDRAVLPADAEDMHPVVAFTVITLGGFRGFIADMLWIRMIELQDAGKHFELLQLADWITKLEPGHAQIWGFHAWNLAYNISVLMPEKEDRWRWVQNGVNLLRDKGLKYNPEDPELYTELGWIFQHKIGGNTDRYHLYYKEKLAQKMTDVLGGGFPDYEKTGKGEKELQMLKENGLRPRIMRKVDSRFGPLDWRLPETHALYWAYSGILKAGEEEALLSNDRMVMQNLATLVLEGSLVYKPEEGIYRQTPLLEIFPKAERFYGEMLGKYENAYVREVYARFLRESAQIFRERGREEKALALVDKAERIEK